MLVSDANISVQDTMFCLLTWNVGFCGLSKEMDFFYDGGKMVRPTYESSYANLEAIRRFVQQQDSVDFFLFQDIDMKAKRSYYLNQYDSIAETLSFTAACIGINYNVKYVPIPLYEPMGSVLSGIATYSRFIPDSCVRYSYPGNYDWPMKVFMLDRCFLVSRYPLSGGKQLIVVNTHNSAYDDGSLRKEQMKFLKDFLQAECRKGNYVIVGGDWNQCPPGYDTERVTKGIQDDLELFPVEDPFIPGWEWTYDITTPTN
ncbi:MAG: hypothetical protein C0594_03370, partial [Marinilabiliales bacterium]